MVTEGILAQAPWVTHLLIQCQRSQGKSGFGYYYFHQDLDTRKVFYIILVYKAIMKKVSDKNRSRT
jgi:hypothetical protein